MKHLKTKLSAAIVMLLISAMMLTGVSFAWYTLSTNPEVTGITATAVANENLEIALDNYYADGAAIDTASSNASLQGGVQGSKTLNDYTWGNMIDVTNQMTGGESATGYAFALRPAEYKTGGGLQTYKYGTDGRISAVQALTDAAYYGGATSQTPDTETTSSTQVNGVARVYNDDATSDTDYAFKVVYWLRTNKTGNIDIVSTGVGRADGADASDLATGGGSYISTAQYGTTSDKYTKDALHVAFKVTPYTGTNGAAGTAYWVEDTDIDYGAISGTKVALSMKSGKHIITSATPNAAYKVEMYVFLNGDAVTNAMAEEAIAGIAVNVQFDNDAISGNGAMKY